MSNALRFYRTTEGLVITLVAYALAAFGVYAIFAGGLDAAPAFVGVPVALASLVFAGAGFYLYYDALDRLLNTLAESAFIHEVMNA
jgi:hypothetical protein